MRVRVESNTPTEHHHDATKYEAGRQYAAWLCHHSPSINVLVTQ